MLVEFVTVCINVECVLLPVLYQQPKEYAIYTSGYQGYWFAWCMSAAVLRQVVECILQCVKIAGCL